MNTMDYLKLPYTKIVREIRDESGHYFYGRIAEMDGCQTTGETAADVLRDLEEVLKQHIEIRIENNMPVPMPGK